MHSATFKLKMVGGLPPFSFPSIPYPFAPFPLPAPSPALPCSPLPLEVGPLKSSYGVWGALYFSFKI